MTTSTMQQDPDTTANTMADPIPPPTAIALTEHNTDPIATSNMTTMMNTDDSNAPPASLTE